MSSCDIGVVSSIGSETNCRVVLEWMSVGKPVVGTTVGVIPEVIVDGKTGSLVPAGDSLRLADALMKLIDNKKKCADYGLAGRAIVEKEYTIEKMVKNTLDFYEEALV